ncbi:MAG: hypothetical protein C4K49_10115 [Candidatus Thorarchaeota archaeon]|nr:MAG: hypothetical protein C4K49_10115 [Candidatus Thorarchaeota archaeon]
MLADQSDTSDACTSSWDFAGSPTQYSTHGIHTYLAAMIPWVAKRAITTAKPRKLLDPFCGGGAVLVESLLAGIACVGLDINPLAVLISKVKTKCISSRRLMHELGLIVEKACLYDGPVAKFTAKQGIDYWYKDYMLGPLTALRHAVMELGENQVKDFFRCILSATARDVSLTHRNEIRLRRLESPYLESFNPDVIDVFRKNAVEAAERVAALPKLDVAVHQGSVLGMPFADDEFSTIVCSPPYGDERNGVPYTQFAKNMLFWLGYSWDDIIDQKRKTLGWINGREDFPQPDSQTLRKSVHLIRDHLKSVKEVNAFYHDYDNALTEMARVTDDKIVIVIGQRVMQNTVFDNARITIELMASKGIRLGAQYRRHLPTKRLPRMREYGAAIDHEDILFFDVRGKNM